MSSFIDQAKHIYDKGAEIYGFEKLEKREPAPGGAPPLK